MIFCEIVVPMEIGIPAKFDYFMATGFLRIDIRSCQKKVFFVWRGGTSYLGKSGITSALIEIQSSFYVHSRDNEMPFPVTSIYSAQLCFQGL
jgi:hypothetical protein